MREQDCQRVQEKGRIYLVIEREVGMNKGRYRKL